MAALDDNAYGTWFGTVTFKEDRLEVFEAILGITIGSTFLIEFLQDISHQPILDFDVAEENFGNYKDVLIPFLDSTNITATNTKPVVVILHWEGMEGAVHYVLWFGDVFIWDPYEIVGYPNPDSWCQTCITAKLMNILVPYSAPALPWEAANWTTLSSTQRHIKLRNLAVELVKLGIQLVGHRPSDSHPIIQDAITEAQSEPPVNYFNLGSFLLELELPRFKN